MALTNEDLLAIGQLLDSKLDERLKSIADRLDIIELKQDIASKKLDDLRLGVKVAERDIRRDIHKLNDEMETIVMAHDCRIFETA